MVKGINEIINQFQKIIAWGAGDYFSRFHSLLEGKLSYVVDNNQLKQGQELNGVKVVFPDSLLYENPMDCIIIVFSIYFDEIANQILKYGEFTVLDIITYKSILMWEKKSCGNSTCKLPDSPIVICGGMHAMWETNGSRKFIDGQRGMMQKSGLETIDIVPLQYYEHGREGYYYIWANFNDEWSAVLLLAEFIELYPIVQGFIIHSLYYAHQVLEKLLCNMTVKTSVLYYVHDYYCICKQRFLYNGKKPCISYDGSLKCKLCDQNTIQVEHMQFHKGLFQKYGVVLVAPSEDTKRRIENIVSYYNITVIPHLNHQKEISYSQTDQKEKNKVRSIAYIGSANWLKGWGQFAEIVELLKNQYQFYCIGHCPQEMKIGDVKYIDVQIAHGKNMLTMVEALLAYHVDMVFLWSIWPETYSYTYFEAFEAGCFVLTGQLSGNICDQVLKNQNGLVFQDIKQVVAFLTDQSLVSEIIENRKKKICNVKPNAEFLNYFL